MLRCLVSMPSEPRIVLRALEEGDLDRTHRWHNEPALYSLLVSPFRFVSKAAELDWLRRKLTYSVNELNLAICLRGNGEHIGNIYLNQIDWVSRRALLGIFIGSPEHRRKGYGQEALRQLVAHAFNDLNLRRIFLEVLADNAAAIKVYEACGFAVEGRLRKHAFKEGAYRDILLMGINKDIAGKGEAGGS